MQEVQQSQNILNLTNAVNWTKQEFKLIEKVIYTLAISKLKDMQSFTSVENNAEAIAISIYSSEFDNYNLSQIREALETLHNRKFFFKNVTNNTFDYQSLVPITFARYHGGKGKRSRIELHINGMCKKLFLELAQGYTKLDLKSIMNLNSLYAIRMYELLSMKKSLNKGIWTVQLSELRSLLNIPETSEYAVNYSRFKSRVLDYSKSELEKKCQLLFDYQITGKEGKKVTEISFQIVELKVPSQSVENSKKYYKELDDLVEQIMQQRDLYVKLQAAFSQYTLRKDQMDRIESNPDLIRQFIKMDMIIDKLNSEGKPVNNPTAFLVTSLKIENKPILG